MGTYYRNFHLSDAARAPVTTAFQYVWLIDCYVLRLICPGASKPVVENSIMTVCTLMVENLL